MVDVPVILFEILGHAAWLQTAWLFWLAAHSAPITDWDGR